MNNERSNRKDRIAVSVMVMALMAFGVVGLSSGEASFDTSAWIAASDAEWLDAGTRIDLSEEGTRVAQAPTADWFAADSPQGARPAAVR